MLEILKIQGQIIDNLNYMLDYIYSDQKRMEAKIDSLLIILQKDKRSKRKQKSIKFEQYEKIQAKKP